MIPLGKYTNNNYLPISLLTFEYLTILDQDNVFISIEPTLVTVQTLSKILKLFITALQENGYERKDHQHPGLL